MTEGIHTNGLLCKKINHDVQLVFEDRHTISAYILTAFSGFEDEVPSLTLTFPALYEDRLTLTFPLSQISDARVNISFIKH